MAGHSKWANIKHRKQVVDLKKSKQFQKIIKELQNLVVHFGSDLKTNPLLKKALVRAKAANVPKDAILKVLHHKQSSVDLENKNTFWLGARFAKQVSLLLKFIDLKKSYAINQFQKLVQKSKLEILPTSSVEYLFTYVVVLTLESLSENQLSFILSKFAIYDFLVQKSKVIIYFDKINLIKDFQIFAQNNQINILQSSQNYFSKIKVKIEKEVKDDFLIWKEKILTETSCCLIIDNLE